MDWAIAGVLIGVNTTVMVAVGGWMFLQMQSLKAEMRQQHQDLLAILQGHTHSEEGTAAVPPTDRHYLKPQHIPVQTISTEDAGPLNIASESIIWR